MGDDFGFGGNSIFDSDHDGHLNAFERDHAECFLHDCDIYDQVLKKEGSLSSRRNSSSSTRKTVQLAMAGDDLFSKSHSDGTPPPPADEGGYNLHEDFEKKYPKAPKSEHNALKFLLVTLVVGFIAIMFNSAKNFYAEYNAKEADAARQKFATEVQNWDLTPYCKDYITSLEVTNVRFNGTNGYRKDDSLYHTNNVIIEGTVDGIEQLTHEDIYEYVYTLLTEMYSDVDKMCESSNYPHHINRGHAKHYGATVRYYRNFITIILCDSINEYRVYDFNPTIQEDSNNFYVKVIAGANKGEEWMYKVTTKDGAHTYKLFAHTESEADERARRRDFRERYGNKSNSNSLDSSGSSTRRRSSGSYKKKDNYNSSRYKDADSFAEDHYEDFYDYGDYEDDDDAYDAAVDYWNDWND